MRILFASSEVTPFAKTGGLADVAGALPQALSQLGHDVRIIMPLYGRIDREKYSLGKTAMTVAVPVDGKIEQGRVFTTELNGVPVYLLEHENYFNRTGLYGENGSDYPDNAERFTFFCRAIIDILEHQVEFRPDIIHVHDWQTALIPLLLQQERQFDPFYEQTATLLTIHNLGYQGIFPPKTIRVTGLDPGLMQVDGLEYHGNLSLLKGGLLSSDALNTVSPTYCREILTPEKGHGFDGILRRRRRDLFGVLNGIDTHDWNPKNEHALRTMYGPGDLEGKQKNRPALQKLLDLEPDSGAYLAGMVTRVAEQKGFDILLEAIPQLMELNLQLAILGDGDPQTEDALREFRDSYPGRISLTTSFNDLLARRIYGGSDMFLMPSHYEPCGLGQMIALRFGSLPVVRRTGGLADTIVDPQDDPDNANGILFDEATAAALVGAVERAIDLFADPDRHRDIMTRGMTQDLSWNRSANEYLEIYQYATEVKLTEEKDPLLLAAPTGMLLEEPKPQETDPAAAPETPAPVEADEQSVAVTETPDPAGDPAGENSPGAGGEAEKASHFPELDELQHDIQRRIRDNQKFLDHFLDLDYVDEDEEDDEDDEVPFEEL